MFLMKISGLWKEIEQMRKLTKKTAAFKDFCLSKTAAILISKIYCSNIEGRLTRDQS